MKLRNELMQIKGLNTPNLSEPIGDKFEEQLKAIHSKVEDKRVITNDSKVSKGQLKSELIDLKTKLLYSDDLEEKEQILIQCEDLQRELDSISDLDLFNVNHYAKTLVDTDKLKHLEEESRDEYLNIANDIKEYKRQLEIKYSQTMNELNRFIADIESDSSYKKANRLYRNYRKGD